MMQHAMTLNTRNVMNIDIYIFLAEHCTSMNWHNIYIWGFCTVSWSQVENGADMNPCNSCIGDSHKIQLFFTPPLCKAQFLNIKQVYAIWLFKVKFKRKVVLKTTILNACTFKQKLYFMFCSTFNYCNCNFHFSE